MFWYQHYGWYIKYSSCFPAAPAFLQHLLTFTKHPVPCNFFYFFFRLPVRMKWLHKQHFSVPYFNADNRHGIWCAQGSFMLHKSACTYLFDRIQFGLFCYVHNHEMVGWWRLFAIAQEQLSHFSIIRIFCYSLYVKIFVIDMFAQFFCCAAATKVHWCTVFT